MKYDTYKHTHVYLEGDWERGVGGRLFLLFTLSLEFFSMCIYNLLKNILKEYNQNR